MIDDSVLANNTVKSESLSAILDFLKPYQDMTLDEAVQSGIGYLFVGSKTKSSISFLNKSGCVAEVTSLSLFGSDQIAAGALADTIFSMCGNDPEESLLFLAKLSDILISRIEEVSPDFDAEEQIAKLLEKPIDEEDSGEVDVL